MKGFENYDAWKLATPWDDEPDYEVFESEYGKYYSCDELELQRFEKAAEEKIFSYEGSDEGMEELIEEIAGDFKVYEDESAAIVAYTEDLLE